MKLPGLKSIESTMGAAFIAGIEDGALTAAKTVLPAQLYGPTLPPYLPTIDRWITPLTAGVIYGVGKAMKKEKVRHFGKGMFYYAGPALVRDVIISLTNAGVLASSQAVSVSYVPAGSAAPVYAGGYAGGSKYTVTG
jgi:hypothetical protein